MTGPGQPQTCRHPINARTYLLGLSLKYVHIELDPQKHLITHGCNYTQP